MSEDWLKIIKERLESYESPVPEGVWEDIEASLFPEKARKVRILPWFWGLAAAAAVALGVFIGTRLVDRSVDPTEKIEKIADGGGATSPDTIQHSSSADNGGGQSSSDSDSDSEPIHIVPAPSKSSLALAEEVYAEPEVIEVREVAEASEVSEVSESQEVQEVVEVPVTVQEAAKEAIQETTQESVQEVVKEVKQDEPETVVSNGHEDEDWSKHLSADGSTRDERKHSAGISLASAGNQTREYNAFDTRPFFQGVAANFEPGTKADAHIYSKTMSVPVYKEADHKRPIRFALSLDFPVTKVLSIESGLTYSVLRSSFKTSSGPREMEDSQVLGYLGVPLDIKANLWDRDLFTVYLMGGGMAEKCVSAVTKSVVTQDGHRIGSPEKKTFSVKPLMWSVNAAAGLQFNLPWNLGIYAEPGVSYHFADNTVVSSIYTEHPFDFVLTFGARFSFR